MVMIDSGRVYQWVNPRGHRCMRGPGGWAIQVGNGKWHCENAPIDTEGPIVETEQEALEWCAGDRLALDSDMKDAYIRAISAKYGVELALARRTKDFVLLVGIGTSLLVLGVVFTALGLPFPGLLSGLGGGLLAIISLSHWLATRRIVRNCVASLKKLDRQLRKVDQDPPKE